MWVAANDGYERRRHRESKRRRATDGIAFAGGEEDDANTNKGALDYDSSSDSDSSEISSDGERSTTESVHDDNDDDDPLSSSIGGNNLASSAAAAAAAAAVATDGTSSQAEAAAKQKQRRKRKRSKKKRKQKLIIREETPEATMARLKSSYSSAMTAVGALHRVSKQYCDHFKTLKEKKKSDGQGGMVEDGIGVDANNNVECSNDTAMEKGRADIINIDTTMETENSNNDTSNDQSTALDNASKDGDRETTHREAYNTIQRVAQASRTALEQSLLLDHFVLAPILLPDKQKKPNNSLPRLGNDTNNNMEEMSSAWLDVWKNHHTELPPTTTVPNDDKAAAASKSSTGNSAAIVCRPSLSKWNKLSAAHRTVIKQISYLALVNYADLLLCGYARREINAGGSGVLDRGAVSKLDGLELFTTVLSEGPAEEGEEKLDGNHAYSSPSPSTNAYYSTACLWTNESTERTIRLALAAYCDASELDSTDPTLWFKLACAARALGWEMDRQSSPSPSMAGGPPSRSSYRCLERLALERGLSSLPPGVPPNRLLMRAWREMESWDRRSSAGGNIIAQVSSEDAEDIPQEKKSPVELVIHLPRYSWATLGRILIRACQEGVSYGRSLPDGALHHIWSTNCNSPEDFDFGSPLVDVRISPLLAIPQSVLGRICEYLEESTDIKRLTCACRAMSSELTSAMAEMTEAKKRSTVASETGRCDEPKDNGTAVDSTGGCGTEDISRDNATSSAPIDNQNDVELTPPRRGRVSKRVRSQLLESVKESERKSKRSNVQYCLLAGTLSCTAQHPYYKKLLETNFDWEQLPLFRKCIQTLPTEDEDLRLAVAAKSMSQMDRTFAFIAPSSLNEFVHRLSGNNSGPRDFLEHFLLHVSLNVGDVFDTENTESLASCALDCFDAMVACSKRNMEETPWYGPESYEDANGNQELALQTLAVNLLNAELLLKRCESHDIGSHGHEEDSDVLAYMVPNLLQYGTMITQTEVSNNANKNILQLQCRFFWLASLYYTWISRYTNDASVSKEAEDLGLRYLDKAMACLLDSSDTLIIKTPQLASSDRPGDHSKLSHKSLSKYREHLQSSSVVSRARTYFQDIQRLVEERSQSKVNGVDVDVITAEEKEKLGSLGIELLERYAVGEKASDAIQELLEDFLLLHGDCLHDTDVIAQPQWAGEAQWGSIWTDIPSCRASSFVNLSKVQSLRPSVLQVLAASLLVSEKIASVFLIFAKVASTALLLRAQIIQKENGDGTRADYEDAVENADAATAGTSWRLRLLSLVVNLFTDKMTDMIASYAGETEMSDALASFLVGEDLNNIIILSLQMTPNIQKDLAQNSEVLVPQHEFESVSRLVLKLRGCQGLSKHAQEKVESAYFIALVRALIRLKMDFAKETSSANDKRLKTWQSHIICNIRLICFILNEMAELLSLNPSTVSAGGSVDISHLIKAIIGQDGEGQQMADTCPLAQLTEALLFLYKFDSTSPAEREARSRLTIPVSCAIISLCGSLGVSVEQSFSHIFGRVDEKGANTAYSDYFDSEDSVNGMFLPSGSDCLELKCRRTLLRKICQLVQCVSLVFQSVDDKMIGQDGSPPIHFSQNGPFLPLVVARVASSMSDAIFKLFEEDGWNDSYPFGAREVGNTIDVSLLGRAYMLLFGFSFSGADSDMTKNRAPESIDAATSIFRCIKRVYHDNRKSPPDKAYETVELALPAAEESKVSKAIKAFLFDASKDVEAIHNTTEVPPGFPAWVLSESISTDITGDEDQANIELLRRGIAASLAKGQITHLDSDRKSPSDTDDEKGLAGERGTSQSHELSLDRKFRAVLDDLCYNPNNSERWLVLNECLSFKAEQMCDKLAPIKDDCFEPTDYILCPESKRQEPATSSVEQVQKAQAEELECTRQDWTPFIGDNLSVYMQYPWSSLTSLQACAQDIGSQIDENSPDYMCWRNIESKFGQGDMNSWARSWAGMFVMALRTMRIKALLVARYVAKKSQDGMHPSEVSEDIGTALYGDLMASTVYGYPMHSMTLYEKRRIAERSNFYFQEAIHLSISSDFAQKSQTVVWEVEFMIGKSYGKVASTLREETFSFNSADGDHNARLYETVMIDAIKNYSKSCAGARETEQSRGGTGETGGSSHGYLECLYRLHATRLKVLVAAIKHAPEECELAELEAFRIASTTWFDESNQPATTDIRGKIWSLFADCVDALSHCRNEAPSFHRAAYRLAQAFNFAPAFHNPNCDLSTGSKQTVPAVKSYKIRGLGSGSCAESANIVISKLFDKKRTQLCAVWVTTSAAPPPFEVLNDSVRKYDAIRLKYIRAYIESMQECGLKDKIEALLSWTATSGQDLASFYSASAALKGGDPGMHSKQSLLVGPYKGFIPSVKHHSIRALAEMILKDLAALKKNGVDNEGKLKLTKLFKLASSLFLRLNAPCNEVAEYRQSNKLDIELDIVDAFCRCYLSIQSGYRISSIQFDEMEGTTLCSILEGAKSKAKTLAQEAKATSKKEKTKD